MSRDSVLRAAIALAALVTAFNADAADRPSRAAFKNCAWEKLADATVGLAAWVQRCDYGFRKIDFLFQGRSLAVRFSDGGKPDAVIDVIDMEPGESRQDAIKRHFAAHTEPAIARRCTLGHYRGKPRAGAQRYTFVPNAAYRKEISAKSSPDEVGDPPCGEWGDAPDGIQYFEVPFDNAARKVLFVRVGQDDPLFDEQTLRTIAPARAAKK